MNAALRYEWRRITSIRATYVLSGLFLLATGAVAWLLAQATNGALGGEAGEAIPVAIPFAVVAMAGTNFLSAIFVTTIAAQSFGHEYRYGLIRLTLSEFPRRGVVYAAKLVMVLAWVAVLYAVSLLVALVMLKLSGGQLEPLGADSWWGILRALLFLLGYCTIAFTLTALTRNLVLGVVIPLLLGAVVEQLAVAGLQDRLPWLKDYLPIMAGNAFVEGGDAMWRGGLVFLAWVAALVVASLLQFERRDA